MLGDLQSTVPGRTSVSGTQERVAFAADLAPLQRAHPSPRDGLRPGVRPLEDARPPGQASGPNDRDPQTRSPQASIVSQAEADDTAGHPPCTGCDQDWRHLDANGRWPAIGLASRRPPRAGASSDLGGSEADPAGAARHAGSHFVVKTWTCTYSDSSRKSEFTSIQLRNLG